MSITAACRSIEGISRHRRNDLADLLRVLKGNTLTKGPQAGQCCYPIRVLAEKLGWCLTKFHNVKRLAIKLGLLESAKRMPSFGGQLANGWRIIWEKVESLISKKKRAAGDAHRADRGARFENVQEDARACAKTKETKEKINTNGFYEDGSQKTAKGTGKKVRWPFTIQASDLRNDERVYKLYREAVKQGVVSESPTNLREFYVYAEAVKNALNPPGLFTRFVNGENEHDAPMWAEDAAIPRYKRATDQLSKRVAKPRVFEGDESEPAGISGVLAGLFARDNT